MAGLIKDSNRVITGLIAESLEDSITPEDVQAALSGRSDDQKSQLIRIWDSFWPRKSFKTDSDWLEYCQKWSRKLAPKRTT